MATPGYTTLHWSDIVVIVLYFAIIIFIGLWSSRSNRGSVGGYFLAGRNMHWAPVGASLFASNIGSVHFVGLAGSGAAVGISNYLYEINAIYVVILLGWFFLPVYISSGITTMPEYLRKRFGRQRIRIYLAVLSLLLYVFTKISADLFSGALFIEQALGWNIYASICLLLFIAALFTVTGGLTAVIWTDFMQTFIMIGGSLALMAIAFMRVGGIEGMRHKYERAVPNETFYGSSNYSSCGYPREDYFALMRHPKTGDIPWPGVFGVFINSLWYWCADQVIVQRTLASKNYSHAKAGTMLCGYLKFLPLFILVFPGMIARILFPDEVACVDPEKCREICGNPNGCSNIAYPLLVVELMPNAARGLLLAVMLSALMSSLTSIFNSSSTVFTIDIWKKIRKNAKDKELMIVSRLCVIVLVAVSIAWIPVIQISQGSQLFVYIQQITSYLTPPISAVYVLAILTPRINELGAFWGLIAGMAVGLTRFILEFSYPVPSCPGEDTRPGIIKNFHYLYFALFLWLFTGLVAMIISFLTKPIDKKHLWRLTWSTRYSKEPREDIDDDSILDYPGVMDPDDKKSIASLESLHGAKKCWKGFYNWICGIEKMVGNAAPEFTEEELAEMAKKAISIEEKPKEALLTNINCIILMSLAAFVWGFLAIDFDM